MRHDPARVTPGVFTDRFPKKALKGRRGRDIGDILDWAEVEEILENGNFSGRAGFFLLVIVLSLVHDHYLPNRYTLCGRSRRNGPVGKFSDD